MLTRGSFRTKGTYEQHPCSHSSTCVTLSRKKSVLGTKHPDVRQRYILAVFYFASHVDPSGDTISWKRCGSPSNECEEVFLSEKHVCDWFGITCHENNDVKRISLRKLSPCLVILYSISILYI